MEDGSEARQAGGVPPKRQGAKAAGSVKPKGDAKDRVQFHIHSQVIKRLGVHAALTQRSQSAIVEQVLLSYLSRHGQGRDLFPPVKATFLVEDVTPDA